MMQQARVCVVPSSCHVRVLRVDGPGTNQQSAPNLRSRQAKAPTRVGRIGSGVSTTVSLVEQAEPLGEAVVETPQAGTRTGPDRVGSRRRGRSFLAPAARPTNSPLVEQAEPLGEAVVETPQAGTRTGLPGSRRRGRSPWSSRPSPWARPLSRPRKLARVPGSGVSTTRSLVPRSRCSTNETLSLVEPGRETPQAGTRTGLRGLDDAHRRSCDRASRWSSRPSPWARPSSRPRKLTRVPGYRGLDDAVARSSLPLLDQRRPLVGRAGRAPASLARVPGYRGLDDAVARSSLPLLDQRDSLVGRAGRAPGRGRCRDPAS